MKTYIKKMFETDSNVSLMRHCTALIVVVACGIAITSLFVKKDCTTLVIGMLTAAGISKAVQTFGEGK